MAVTVSYNVQCTNAQNQPAFILGSTTPPTAQQASTVQEIEVDVIFADGDTQALITHNWGFTASQTQNFAFPQIIPVQILGTTQGTFATAFTYNLVASTNTITMNKLAFNNSGGTWRVHLRRPWSASS